MSADERLRATVEGPVADIVELEPADVTGADGRAGLVTELIDSPTDRSLGARRFEVVVDGWRFRVSIESARHAALRERAARAAEHHAASPVMTVKAEIPGRVVRLWVKEGDRVEQGQRLLAVEAMKMENEIRAPHGGTVSGLRVAPGELVERHDELLSIA